MSNTPVFLYPTFKDYLWGGTRLREEYNKKCDYDKIAESWELSTHKDGESVIASGEYKGLTLSEYLLKNPNAIGIEADKFDFFPILIKFIDAKDNLSIQVHPDDEYSLKNNGEYGKTEMWYILDCAQDAGIYYGFSKKITKEEFKKSIENNTLTEILNWVPVKKGDVFFIEAGTVHAIGKGIVICEIQQNSNTTYRVYDYGRVGADGKTRPLHIEQALEVSKTEPPKKYEHENESILAKCKYFTVEKYELKNEKKKFDINENSFRSVVVTEGEGNLTLGKDSLSFRRGDSIFIPAQEASYEIDGECSVIISYV